MLRTIGVASVPLLAGCLGDEDDPEGGDDGVDDHSGDDGGGGTDDDDATDDGGNDDADDADENSVGTAEIEFLGETYTFDDASCDGSRTFPPENEQIRHRDADAGIEFWVERHDPEESDAVDVHFSFPSGDAGETIGEVEAYTAQTTVDEIEFELGSGTSGALHLEPSNHMNDDVEHDPDGGEITWEIAC